MKKLPVTLTIIAIVLSLSWQLSGNFEDAVASWSLSDLNDRAGINSQLKKHGSVEFIVLTSDEAKASKERGGDAMVARLNGGWLDAGQGINDELNLNGKNASILVRFKADKVEGMSPLVGKAGNDQNMAYSLFLVKSDNDVFIESQMGSDEIAGLHMLRYKLPPDEINKWHDVVIRFNGQVSQMYVDGLLRDEEVTVGEIRNWNRRPVLIGAQYKNEFGYANVTNDQVEARFNGLIDHVVLWEKYISDEQLKYVSGVKELKDGKPQYYHEKYRPQFHFSAKKNWLNDPNGLVYYDGVYHMFFQYQPPHRPGAYKDWGHATSKDLVHWEQINNHITPHKVWSGCWSGSAVVDSNNTAGLQTGKEKTIVAFITSGGNPSAGLGPMCTQTMAYSNDGGKTFTYYDQNPVIKNIYKENRDPKVVWDEDSKQWIMSLFMDKDYDFGIFASTDLKNWKHLSTFSIEGVRECPGFEPLFVDGDKSKKKWIFFGANGDYVIGTFDAKNFKPETKVLRGDYGLNFYAPQTWSDTPEKRCVMLAWMPTERYPGMPFTQQMNFPTELTLRTTPEGVKAFRLPVKEIQNLYSVRYKGKSEILKKLTGDIYEMNFEVNVKDKSSFTFMLRNVKLTYNANTNMLSCGGDPVRGGMTPDSWISPKETEINELNNMGRAPLKPVNGKIKLKILLDRNTIEVFANNGEVVLSSCFMPKDEKPVYSFNSKDGAALQVVNVYSLKSAWPEL
nr:GH32 C-terminal domain-containing protein [Pedobacter panaciterrae]